MALLMAMGCQSIDGPALTGPNEEGFETLANRSLKANTLRPSNDDAGLTQNLSGGSNTPYQEAAGVITELGSVPSLTDALDENANGNVFRPNLSGKRVDTFIRPLPVSEFIDVVFGGILEQPYVTGPGVAEMDEIVQLRSSGEMEADTFLELVTGALENYGIRVVPENGAFQLIEDKVLRARTPRFIKSRARPGVKAGLRPIVQFVELRAVRPDGMYEILQQAFPAGQSQLRLKSSGRTNYITLTGLPDDIDAALTIIKELDDLDYAGSQIQRYSPQYWDAEALSLELDKVLTTEGWQVSRQPGLVRPISILAVTYTNDLFIFTQSDVARTRIAEWLGQLDRPVQGGDIEDIFIYQVRNVDAQILAETANTVLRSASVSGNNGADAGGRGLAANSSGTSARGGGRFTVDTLGNRIIIQSTVNEYRRLATLLETLDTPAPEVLIEVQIAEVSLNDATSSGVELIVDDLGGTDIRGTASNNGLGQGSTGLNISLLSGNVDARINALATNREVKLLSTPVLVARSGGAAQIQVGTDVPIITSQSAANTQSGNGTLDVLQQVTYRKTGVLLNIEPIVFSDYRVDLTISQEVSATIDSANTSISSPTISNRNLSTQLSLEDGQTAVLGGLVQENVIRDDKGVPFLKDIPALGAVFSNDSYSVDRTELVVLITAYVLRGQADKTAFVRTLSRSVDAHINEDARLVTLNPIIGME